MVAVMGLFCINPINYIHDNQTSRQINMVNFIFSNTANKLMKSITAAYTRGKVQTRS